MGILPNVLVARSEIPTNGQTRTKLSNFCGVPEAGIAILPNARTVYEVPLTLEEQGIGEYIVSKLKLNAKKPKHDSWKKLVDSIIATPKKTYHVGVVAKYLDNQDTYMSVFEALRAGSWAEGVGLEISWVDAESLNSKTSATKALKDLDGIVVPGGFGSRGIEGKIAAAQYALTNKVPYLGLCLGMQVAVIAAARNSGVSQANSTEFAPNTTDPVIHTMIGQSGKENTGGTMRLGDYPCSIEKKSKAADIYGKTSIVERHRHRYEANNAYLSQYESWGIKAVGKSPDGKLVEMIEAVKHPFFVASQFHPEFLSRPNVPHPMFQGFIASLKK
jgi:CTP synthase